MSIFNIGDTVIWLHRPKGDPGFVYRIPAVIVGKSTHRFRIQILPNRMKSFKTHRVSVLSENLVLNPSSGVGEVRES